MACILDLSIKLHNLKRNHKMFLDIRPTYNWLKDIK